MPKSRISSPSRSHTGPTTPRRYITRRSLSVNSPASSNASGRLTTHIDQFKENNMESFTISPMKSRWSVLTDNTEIEEPHRKSWWKTLNENSHDHMELLEDNEVQNSNFVDDISGMEVESQESKNYSLDLPESSDSESIHSIVITQRKLFSQKENKPLKKFGKLMGPKETVTNRHTSNTTLHEKTITAGTKELFKGTKRSKLAFSTELVSLSVNKTTIVDTEPKVVVKSIFGNRPAKKHKNMFAEYIEPESEVFDEDVDKECQKVDKVTVENCSDIFLERHIVVTEEKNGKVSGEDKEINPETNNEEMHVTNKSSKEHGITKKLDEVDIRDDGKGEEGNSKQNEGNHSENGDKATHKMNQSKKENLIRNKANDEENISNQDKGEKVTNEDYEQMEYEAGADEIHKMNKIQNNGCVDQEDKQKQDTTVDQDVDHADSEDQEMDHEESEEEINDPNIIQEEQHIEHGKTIEESEKKINEPNIIQEEQRIEHGKNIEESEEEINEPNVVQEEQRIEHGKNIETDKQTDHIQTHIIAGNELNVEIGNENIEENENEKSVEQIRDKDIHRKTRNSYEQINYSNKTITPRKSLKTLVMEKSAEQTVQTHTKELFSSTRRSKLIFTDALLNISAIQSESVMVPQANSTEYLDSNDEDVAMETDHELPKRTRQSTLDSESESFHSIVMSQRKLFSQKEDKSSKFGQIVATREPTSNLNKSNASPYEKIIAAGTKDLLQGTKRSKLVFSASLLNASTNKIEEKCVNHKQIIVLDKQTGDNREQIISEIQKDDEVAHKNHVGVGKTAHENKANDVEIANKSRTEIDEANVSKAEVEESANETNAEVDESVNESNAEVDESANESNAAVDESANESIAEVEESANETNAEVDESANESNVELDESNNKSNAEIDEIANLSNEDDESSEEIDYEESEEQIPDDNQDQDCVDSDEDIDEVTNDENQLKETSQHDNEDNNESDNDEQMRYDESDDEIQENIHIKQHITVQNNTQVVENQPTHSKTTEVRVSSVGNSSAEGSGWDSHRTTRKTLRQTFGKDFTPRKSLRALVMEKSAKKNANLPTLQPSKVLIPQANSTEYFDSNVEGAGVDASMESDHEHSRIMRQATLETYLQEIKQQNIEKKSKMDHAIRNSIKLPPTRDAFNLFKVPTKPPPRKLKPTPNKPKKPIKSVLFQELPSEVVEDMKYKPPKRFRPSNASWITKRLYKFLETKLEPKYDYKARVRAEKLVETIYNFAKDLRRHDVASTDSVNVLKHELARLEVVKTHFEFYELFHEFMPREIRVKVVPDIINKISLPRHGVFSDILK